MAKVLYRKYRPRTFSEVSGQEHIITTLQNAISSGNVAHAYLFTGPRGTGKTTVARILAKSLNCISEKKSTEACLKCNSCLEFESATPLDLVEIDAASNRGIDEIRQLKEGVRFASAGGAYKIYLIDEVHMLTKEAFNALLKTIEEPPEHVIFILATTEPHKVLPTIISRCQRFDFRYLTHKEIASRFKNILKKENKTLDAESIKLIIASSGGSLRDAESILGKVLAVGSSSVDEVRSLLGLTDTGTLSSFADLIINSKREEGLQFVDNFISEGGDLDQFINGMIDYSRVLLLTKLSPSSKDTVTANFTSEEKSTIDDQIEVLTEKQIYHIIGALLEVSDATKHSPVPQLPLELAIIKLIDAKEA